MRKSGWSMLLAVQIIFEAQYKTMFPFFFQITIEKLLNPRESLLSYQPQVRVVFFFHLIPQSPQCESPLLLPHVTVTENNAVGIRTIF